MTRPSRHHQANKPGVGCHPLRCRGMARKPPCEKNKKVAGHTADYPTADADIREQHLRGASCGAGPSDGGNKKGHGKSIRRLAMTSILKQDPRVSCPTDGHVLVVSGAPREALEPILPAVRPLDPPDRWQIEVWPIKKRGSRTPFFLTLRRGASPRYWCISTTPRWASMGVDSIHGCRAPWRTRG